MSPGISQDTYPIKALMKEIEEDASCEVTIQGSFSH